MSLLKFEDSNPRCNYKKPTSWFTSLRTFPVWHGLRTHAMEQVGWNKTRQTRSATLKEQPIPWWTYASIQFVDQTISKDSCILEIGGGNSSLYWMGRGNQLVTLETNPIWIKRLTDDQRFAEDRHEVIHISNTDVSSISKVLDDCLFDVAINDGIGDRAEIGSFLATKIKPNGILIWDNSERKSDNEAIEQLKKNGWRTLDFYGIGPINAYAWQTTILYRNFLILTQA